jgi:hypothetical protein
MPEMQEQARDSSDQDDEQALEDGEDRHRQTDRQTDRQTGRQAGRQTDRQTEEAERQGDRNRETEFTLLYYALLCFTRFTMRYSFYEQTMIRRRQRETERDRERQREAERQVDTRKVERYTTPNVYPTIKVLEPYPGQQLKASSISSLTLSLSLATQLRGERASNSSAV